MADYDDYAEFFNDDENIFDIENREDDFYCPICGNIIDIDNNNFYGEIICSDCYQEKYFNQELNFNY